MTGAPPQPLVLDGQRFAAIEVGLNEHILTVSLNRPGAKNALNQAMINELIYAFDYAKQERGVRVVVLAAAGDVFCAGGDLRAMSEAASGEPVSTFPHMGESDDMVLRLHHLDKPVIAKIQGPVLAGALLMVCNATHAIAADRAFFSAPEILRGLWPFQVMAGLFQVMPRRAALDFIMRGYRMSAPEAAKLGLINEMVPAAELDARVATLAAELAGLAPGTMHMGLAAYRAQSAMPFDEALPFLKRQFFECLASDDAKEGIAAFFEKRTPQWK